MNKQVVYIIIGAVVLGIILIYLCFCYKKNKPEKFKPEKNITSDDKTPQFVLFKMDRCVHCKNVEPVWDKLKVEYGTSTDFQLTEVDDVSLSTKVYGIKGFPTIRYYPNSLKEHSNYKEYMGNRSEDSINTFIQTHGEKF